MCFAADLEPNDRAFKRDHGTVVIQIVATTRNELFGAIFSPFGAIHIDLVCALGRFSQHSNLIRQDLDESPRDGQEDPLRLPCL